MGKTLDQIFRSDKTMKLSYLIIILGCLYQFFRLILIKHTMLPLCITLYVTAILYSTVVFFSYKSHDKNIMKPAIGMLIGAIVTYSTYVFMENVLDPEVFADYFNAGTTGYISLILDFLQFALFFVFGILHLAMNKSHESSPDILWANKIITILLYLTYIMQIIFAIPVFDTEKIIYLFAFYLTLASITTLIICIECKIDFFRDQRTSK